MKDNRISKPTSTNYHDLNEKKQPSKWFLKTLLVTVVTLWLLGVFGAFGPLKFLILGVPLISLTESSFSELSSYSVWWQLAARVSEGELIPITVSFTEYNRVQAFYPYLTIWVHGLSIAVFGLELTALIGNLILPIITIFLLTSIYRQFIDLRWAFCLSVLGIVSFSGYPFRNFLLNLIEGKGWHELGQISPPDITQFPFPALSLIAFTAVFYLSIRRIKLNKTRITILTMLWSLQAYVHILNAFIGIVFWLSFIAVRLYRQENDRFTGSTIRIFITQIIILIFVTSLAFIGYFELIPQGIETMNEPTYTNGKLINVILIGYLALPIILLLFLAKIQPIDTFELRTKFLPVWILMGSEVFLLIVHALFSFGPSAELVSARLGIFFIHPLSFIPVIYYSTRSSFIFENPLSRRSNNFNINKIVGWLFKEASYVYLPIFYIFISFYVAASARQGFEFAKNYGQNSVFSSESELAVLSSLKLKKENVAVLETPGANLLIPLRTSMSTLWTPRFANRGISTEEAVERLALYARLVGWTESQFLSFMNPLDKPFSLFHDRVILNSQEITPGVGYWLVKHYYLMSNVEREEYMYKLRIVYKELDISKAIYQYNVKILVLSEDRIPSSIPHKINQFGDKILITIQ